MLIYNWLYAAGDIYLLSDIQMSHTYFFTVYTLDRYINISNNGISVFDQHFSFINEENISSHGNQG